MEEEDGVILEYKVDEGALEVGYVTENIYGRYTVNFSLSGSFFGKLRFFEKKPELRRKINPLLWNQISNKCLFASFERSDTTFGY